MRSDGARLSLPAGLLAIVLVLAGCGEPPSASSPASRAGSDGAVQAASNSESQDARDCDVEAYPCSLADVEPATFERSRALGQEAAARIGGGTSFADTAAWLESLDDMAAVESDDHGLRFRLNGGRFVWVLPDGPTQAATAFGSSIRSRDWSNPRLDGRPTAHYAPRQTDDATVGRGIGSGGAFSSVVGGGAPDKTALVLAPYAWASNVGGAGDLSEILSQTRGYEGGVTYLQNATTHDVDVTPHTYTLLAGYDVVYVRTLGGRICPDPPSCHSVISAADFDDPDLHLTPEEDAVMDIIVWPDKTESYGLTADFFRTHYPGFIQDTILLFDIPGMRLDLAEAIKGTTSEFYYWEGEPEPGAGRSLINTYVGALAESGRSPDYVYHDMVGSMTIDGATFRSAPARPPLRIREVVTLRDASSAEPLVAGQAIAIDGEVDDGEPDRVHLLVDVEGVDPGDEAFTRLVLTVGDAETLAFNVGEELANVDAYTWRLEAEVEVPDVTLGEELDVTAYAELAEGGASRQELSVTVADEPTPEVGRVWQGTVTATSTGNSGPVVTKIAEVTLTRDPDQKPDARLPRFMLASGTLRWSASGDTVNGCAFLAPVVDVDLQPDTEFPVLTFSLPDDPGDPITYSATGSLEGGPMVDVEVSCPGGIGSVSYQERVGGSWWEVPRDGAFQLTGDTITGTSFDGKYRWSLRRVE